MGDKNIVLPFRSITKEDISSAIKTLYRKKATSSHNIPTKSFTSVLKFLWIFFLTTSVVASNAKCFLMKRNQQQLYQFKILSKFHGGFRQGFNAQHCLLVMVEKRRNISDEKGFFATILTDLSKAFDGIPHQLLITKLSAYGSDFK